MLKTFSLIVAGLLAGLAIAWVLPGDDAAGGAPESAGDFFSTAPRNPSPDERLAGLQDALRSETQARLRLEERIEALSAELAALREERSDSAAGARAGGRSFSDVRFSDLRGVEQRDAAVTSRPLTNIGGRVSAEEIREREIERLVEAGFTRDRAEYIRRRSDELEYEVLQAQYEARRTGQPVDSVPTRDQMLRRDLGDAEYEQLLRATNRLTNVSVQSVFAGSPAERGGLRPGDRIVSYAGTRLLEISELNQLIAQGNPGETVIVEVLRDGQPIQLAMPRGPLGVRVQGSRGDGDDPGPNGAGWPRGR